MALNPQARWRDGAAGWSTARAQAASSRGPRAPPRGGRRGVRPGPGPTGRGAAPGPRRTPSSKNLSDLTHLDSYLLGVFVPSTAGPTFSSPSPQAGANLTLVPPSWLASPFMGHVASLRRAPEAAPSPQTRDPPSRVGAPAAGPGLTGRPRSGPQLAPVLGEALPRATAAEPRTLAPG